MLRVIPWLAAVAGFLIGVTLSYLILEEWLQWGGAGSKLSVVIALAPAIGAYEFTAWVLKKVFGGSEPTE